MRRTTGRGVPSTSTPSDSFRLAVFIITISLPPFSRCHCMFRHAVAANGFGVSKHLKCRLLLSVTHTHLELVPSV